MDTFEVSDEMKVGKCNLFAINTNFKIKLFNFDSNFFFTEAESFNTQKSKIFRVETSDKEISLYFSSTDIFIH